MNDIVTNGSGILTGFKYRCRLDRAAKVGGGGLRADISFPVKHPTEEVDLDNACRDSSEGSPRLRAVKARLFH